MSSTSSTVKPAHISDEQVASFQRDGFTKVESIISREEALAWREAAVDAVARLTSFSGEDAQGQHVLQQYVNIWREDETLKKLTLDPRVGAAAERLTGKAMRLWHDHVLIKHPGKSKPTAMHQDQPFWPHDMPDTRGPVSAWIALCDVPVERGCMSFIPGTQHLRGLSTQATGNEDALMSQRPELQWQQRATVPLRAGDCTFHYGTTVHGAFSNISDEARIAHVIIFMEADTRYVNIKHPVTDPLGLSEGDVLEGEMFPAVTV